MKLCIVVGTRPEIIKMSPIINECLERDIPFDLIHTKQHFSENMSDVFFKELELPEPAFSFEIKSGGHGQQIASMLVDFDRLFSDQTYDVVLVEGDTNSVFAAAVMADRRCIPVGHVEAGLRSGDRAMPEEANRIMVDHIASYLFATSRETEQQLLDEGIDRDRIWNAGNTIVDATFRALEMIEAKPGNKVYNDYILLTLHRPGNVDSAEILKEIIEGVEAVSTKYGLSVIFPVHPRTKAKMVNEKRMLPSAFHLMDPLGYLDFLRYEKNAALIMTDSGGVQEEACILNVPCVTLRTTTERPETIAVGGNMLGGIHKETIIEASESMLQKETFWEIPYGDGHSAGKIIDILMHHERNFYNTLYESSGGRTLSADRSHKKRNYIK